MECKVQALGSGFKVQSLEFRVIRICGLGSGVQGLGYRVYQAGVRVLGLEFRV